MMKMSEDCLFSLYLTNMQQSLNVDKTRALKFKFFFMSFTNLTIKSPIHP